MENILYADRFYTAQDFAEILNVHVQNIYKSLDTYHTPQLPLHVPKPIKIGERGYRWTGKQIRDYQIKLAALSGVDISDDDDDDAPPSLTAVAAGKPGRPRNSIEMSIGSKS